MTRDSKVARNILRRLSTCEENFWHGNNLVSSRQRNNKHKNFMFSLHQATYIKR